ncbi:Peroxisome biosynthesis protein pex1 [Elasticomyces elasticus]|uniref:Peroxisomal ATPase PEX1 n=1 Tax=Exophiala sideris TaxID=1016849 RepID=A0ABR0JA18_9EURO|nr:Peroxisome biosynthesis protein pex1 [Elasticomyces elasticus]KAK5026153.1 Peroxisome biosynthesis protein pex1 [Exophiala sideris]KAK5032407.1 Peroxisome biosynthesis protein pex1 [Exophiala sideris]KAK5059563.1 Peroxisome biosynthesis protein pex1 [Exophiala sideris]KAK5178154.1 Peroxisome biosynthesis protein pex1 [Eurotiomycetes sp. CCFEE 6388]
MAPPVRAEVTLVSLKNCLVNLPPGLIALISNANIPAQNVVVELQYRSQTLSTGAVSSGNSAGFQRSAYVGWTGMPSRSRPASVRSGGREQESQSIEIDGTFGKVLGLSEGQKVGILIHLDPPVAHSINIEPLTPADWEAIELHATFLELNLLSQIRALPNPAFSNKAAVQAETTYPLTLHLSPTSTANIIVTSLTPPIPSTSPFAKIAPDAEVIVAPKTRPRSNRSTRGETRSVASRRSGKSGVSNARGSGSRKGARSALFMRGIDRGCAHAYFPHASNATVSSKLCVWLGKDVIASETLKAATWVTVTILKPAGLRAQLDSTQVNQLKEEESSEVGRPASKIVAQVLPWPNPLDDKHAVLSSSVCRMLGVEGLVGEIVRIEAAEPPLSRYSIQKFQFYPFLPSNSKKKDGLKFGGDTKAAKQAVAERLRVTFGGEESLLLGPITDGMILPQSLDASSTASFDGGILRFRAPSSRDEERNDSCLWVLGQEQDREFDVKDEIPRPLDLTTMFPSFAHGITAKATQLVGVDEILKQCMSNLTLCSSVLLTGGVGSGKSSLAQRLAKQLREDYIFNVTYFSCQKLVTDETRVSTVKETLTRLFMSASWCARLGGQSAVILDDLDKICPVETELQVGNDNGRSRQITEILCAIVRQYCSINSGVALLATAQSKDSLHNLIIGGHIVGDIIAIKAPTKEIRRDILHSLIGDKSDTRNGHARNESDQSMSESSWMDPSVPSSRPGSSSSSRQEGFRVSHNLDLLDVAGKTDGYMPADLVLLASRARSESLTRILIQTDNSDAPPTLTKEDFDAALKNFTPSSLRNVTLTHSSTTFSAIGGLHATRNTLLETLLYPTKYAPIFARSPLRLRSGLLLYGYPGCGKTLLASAVAGECNLNFISVKGPEILNKYIGASEKSVRDLFERAQAAKPCVLFFDEFDSIAPKRGHDSTGVTDRVVNQMLTQMDGAEGLEGVYVLAATSRPDLIDPALLRPGRLDKSLLCDMPDMNDRLDILKAVSDKLSLTPEVANRLLSVAQRTEGFSGADLQALMYNAHLEAIHDLLGDNKTGSGDKAGKGMANGTKDVGPGRRRKRHTDKHDFIQFLYSPEEDAKAKKVLTSSATDSKSAIAAKLDELKLARKREKESLRNSYARSTSKSSSYDSADNAGNSREDESGKEEVIIEWSHVEKSLATTRSSISPDERKRLAAIYREFVVGRNGEMPNGEGGREIGGRTSLM